MLATPFRSRADFAPSARYRLLPVRFGRLDDETYVVTNDVGEYVVLPRAELVAFVDRRLPPESATYRSLKSKHFLFDEDSRAALDLQIGRAHV